MAGDRCMDCKFFVFIEDAEHPFSKCALSWQSVNKFEGHGCKFFKDKMRC